MTINAIESALPILLIIFVTVFCLIFLIRIIFIILLNKAYKRYLDLKKKGKKLILKSKKFIKEEDELLRRKIEIPRAHSAVKAEKMAQKIGQKNGSYELMNNFEEQYETQEKNQNHIVDIVKPIGFWTSMILGQKLTYLIQSAQTLNKRGDKGFWASMIEAKEREAGRQHARGR